MEEAHNKLCDNLLSQYIVLHSTCLIYSIVSVFIYVTVAVAPQFINYVFSMFAPFDSATEFAPTLSVIQEN